MNLELGGGARVTPGWSNLDPVNGSPAELRRLAQDVPWPLADGSVGAVRASHVMEHIPAGQDRISVMNECHRVLTPGGTFEIIVPLICGSEPGTPLHWAALADPTHVSFWVPASFEYFDGTKAPCADYGLKLWETVSYETRGGWEGVWVGRPR